MKYFVGAGVMAWRQRMLSDRLKLGKSGIALLAALFLFQSCSSQETTEGMPELPMSEASLLDYSEQSTPVSDDNAIFADLNPMDSSVQASSDPSAHGGDPFYNPLGGESLARVAYTLYGDRKLSSDLRALNPGLAGVRQLEFGQTVYFEFGKLNPTPTYLTKDLIDRYSNELAEKIVSNNEFGKGNVVIEKGETLQALSQRLYGTTRYWTEIYLLNKDSLKGYDRVAAGISLTVFQRGPAALGSPNVIGNLEQANPAAPADLAPAAPTEAPKGLDTQMASPAPMDPIPETSSEPAASPAPEPYVPQDLATVGGEASALTSSSSTNTRRIIYIALILLVGGLAFYFTRPKKKSFDMLDATTNDLGSGRQKLGSEQKKDII